MKERMDKPKNYYIGRKLKLAPENDEDVKNKIDKNGGVNLFEVKVVNSKPIVVYTHGQRKGEWAFDIYSTRWYEESILIRENNTKKLKKRGDIMWRTS